MIRAWIGSLTRTRTPKLFIRRKKIVIQWETWESMKKWCAMKGWNYRYSVFWISIEPQIELFPQVSCKGEIFDVFTDERNRMKLTQLKLNTEDKAKAYLLLLYPFLLTIFFGFPFLLYAFQFPSIFFTRSNADLYSAQSTKCQLPTAAENRFQTGWWTSKSRFSKKAKSSGRFR